jgi:hypothetical protein
MADAKAPTGAELKPPIKPKRERSPSFPFIPLSGAIKRLVEFEEYFKRHPAPAKHSGKAWGMKGWTSQAQQTLAALKSFGLVEYQGSGDTLEATVSEDGRTYLRAQQETVKREVLKRLALKPKNLAKYFTAWGPDRPPNEVCLDQLVLKGGFTEAAAKLFLQVYDATIAYAGLSDSDKALEEEEEEEDDIVIPGVGEVDRTAAQRHAAIPPEQLDRTEMLALVTPPFGTRREVITLDEGDVVITFPENLSSDSFGDLKDHLDLFIKKMQRRAGRKDDEAAH